MTFLVSKSDRSKRVVALATPVVLILLAGALIVLDVPVPRAVTSLAHTFTIPIWEAKNDIAGAVTIAYESLDSKDALVRENSALHEELSIMRRESFNARALRMENERLRKLLGRTMSEKAIPAAVLTSEKTAAFDVVVVDAGRELGIAEGSLVTTEEGIALGTVSKVFDESATVVFFSSPGVETPVTVGASTTLKTTARGHGGGTYTIELPRDVTISVGDPVTLQTFTPHIIGEVILVQASPTAPFQTVYFRVPTALMNIHHVLIEPDYVWRQLEIQAE